MSSRDLARMLWAVALVLTGAIAARAQEPSTPPVAEEPVAAAEEPVTAEEEEKNWSFEVGYEHLGRYVFRGVTLADGNGVHDPHAAFTWGNFSIYYYGYYGKFDDIVLGDFDGPDGVPDGIVEIDEGDDYREADFGLDYTFAIGDAFSLTTGAVGYFYSDITGEDTTELYVIASYDAPFTPTASYFHDIDVFDGGYLSLAASYSFDLGGMMGMSEPMALSIDPSVSLGVDFGYNDPDSSGELNDLLVGVDIPWTVCEWFSIHATLQRSIALDVLDDLGQDDETIGIVGMAVSF